MKQFIVNAYRMLNWKAIIIPGVILSLELLIKSLTNKERKYHRYSEYVQRRIS